MIKLKVEGMTCGHCVKNITSAIQEIEPGALVQVDLANKLVTINSAEEFTARFKDAVAEAGYPVADPAETRTATPACRCCA